MDSAMLVTLIVGLLGGGTVATIVVALLNRRKTSAETKSIDVSASATAVGVYETAVNRLTAEIGRLDERVTKAQALAVIADERSDANAALERQCRVELNSLIERHARMVIDLAEQVAVNKVNVEQIRSLGGRVTTIESASSDMLKQMGLKP